LLTRESYQVNKRSIKVPAAAMTDESDTGKVVEEFPAPPTYYKHFTPHVTIASPIAPASNPYLEAYSGCFAYVHENTPKADEHKNYKRELKRYTNLM
jgi:hypothetical protein